MSSKISALPVGSNISDLDLLTAVQGGINVKITRPNLLSAPTGETISLVGDGGGRVDLSPGGDVELVIRNGANFSLVNSSGDPFLTVDPSNNVNVHAPPTQQVLVGDFSTAYLQLQGGTAILASAAGASAIVQYDPANPGNWSGSPTSLHAAIDRIATTLSGIIGGPIL